MTTPSTLWIVRMATGFEKSVSIPAGQPEHVAASLAEVAAERETFDRAFSARPSGCTGLSYRAHVGRFCPVHPNA